MTMKKTGKVERIKQITEILLEHGLVDFIKRMGLSSFISRTRLEGSLEKRMEEVDAEDLRYLFEDLGPAFIKLGQFLALRPDLVPIEFANELRKLYEEASPFPGKEARRIVQEELGKDLNEIFEEFYSNPLASASIGQVHEATLKNGEEVVVKVQRPNIQSKVRADMDLIERMARLIEDLIPESEIYHPKDTVKEFKDMLKREMDYTVEARSGQRFYDAFIDDEDVIVPKVHWDYVTKRVLVLDNVHGKSIRHAIDSDIPKEKKKIIAKKFAQTMLKQFFLHGIFHADPSPGNIFYTEDDKIVLLDFGAIGHLSESRRNKLIDMFLAMARSDTKKVMDILIDLGEVHGEFDKQELEWDIENLLELYKRRPDVLFREGANEEIMMIVKKHNISLPANFLLMERALIETEGICTSLDPKFDFFEAAEPIIADVFRDRYGPKAQIDKIFDSAKGYHDLLVNLPHRLNNLLEGLEERDFAVTIEHKGLDDMESQMELIANRLSFTIITAAIIIGSALIVLSTQQPLFGPYIFFLSVLIGIWLLVIIIKRGKY